MSTRSEAEPATPAEAPWLSVVLPVRDEAGPLPELIAELRKVADQIAGDVELVFVDDGSGDGSLELLRRAARADTRVHVESLATPRGQSGALARGFAVAKGDVIATLDADGQNDPADLPRLLAVLERSPGVDVVCGVRVGRQDSRGRKLVSRVANAVRNRLTHEQVRDVGCSLRVMRAPFVRRVRLESGLHRFLPTLLRIEGARVVEAPVSHRPRRAGRSKYGLFDRLPQALRDLWTVRRRVLRAEAERAQR